MNIFNKVVILVSAFGSVSPMAAETDPATKGELNKVEKLLQVQIDNLKDVSIGSIRNYRDELGLRGTYELFATKTGLKYKDGSQAPDFPIGTPFRFINEDEKNYWISADCTWVPNVVGRCDGEIEHVKKKDADGSIPTVPDPAGGSNKNQTKYRLPQNNRIVVISKSRLEDGEFQLRRAITHGVLVAPFKYRTADKSISGQSTLGYFVGLRSDSHLGSGTTFGSLGLGVVDVATQTTEADSSTKVSVESETALSAVLGYSFATKTKFQISVMVGIDHLGGAKGEDWLYEDDHWFSVGLGFDILNH